jgi:hypothetical protein
MPLLAQARRWKSQHSSEDIAAIESEDCRDSRMPSNR